MRFIIKIFTILFFFTLVNLNILGSDFSLPLNPEGYLRLNSLSSLQNEFKDEVAQASIAREQDRDPKNSLVKGLMDDAVQGDFKTISLAQAPEVNKHRKDPVSKGLEANTSPVRVLPAGAARIAVVDVQYVLANSVAMRNIHKSIENLSKSIEKDVSSKEVEFKKLEENLIKQKNQLNEKDFEEQINKFNKQVTGAQQDIQSKKVRLEQAHNSAVEKVHRTIVDIINDMSKKHTVNLILPSSQILYADTDLNITNEVLELLNSKLKQVEVKY